MKKLYLTLTIVFALVLCLSISVFAADITVEADDLSDIQTAIAASSVDDNITVNLKADVLIPNQASAIIIDKDITLTINFNGYTLMNNSNGGTAGKAYGILLKSYNARLVLNGTSSVDPFNYVEPTDETITVSNGEIVNPNKEKGVKSPDYASNGPAVVVYSGTIELNDMYINQYNTGEWGIFFMPSLGDNIDIRNNIIAKNSIVRVHAGRYGALGTRQGDSILKESYVAIEDCVIYGTGTIEWLSMSANSYIKDSRIADYALKIDSYLKDNYAREGNEAILQNVYFESSVSLCTGAIYVNMIDCSFANSMKIDITGDSQGKTRFTITETADCEKAGRQAYAEAEKNVNKTLNSFEDFPNVVGQYTIDNPAKGHTANLDEILDLVYENGFINAGTYICACVDCGAEGVKEKTPSAEALITFVGISTSIYNDGICVGYSIDREAIENYRSYGKAFEYGVVAYIPLEGETNVDPIGTDLTPIDYTVSTPLKFDYSSVDFVIKGFGTNTEIPLAMCAYVYDGTEVDYINTSISDSITITQDDYVSTFTLSSVLAYTKVRND